MRHLLVPALTATLMAQSPTTASEGLKIGDPMPSFNLPNTEGQMMDSKLLHGPVLVVFLSTKCPEVLAAEDRINALTRTFAGSVAVVGINSIDSTLPGNQEESLRGMKSRIQEKKYVFRYLYLKDENQDVARAFGARQTPDFFLFNQGKLVYHGRLDDNAFNTKEVTRHDLYEAMRALEGGKPTDSDQVPTAGCGIRWKAQK